LNNKWPINVVFNCAAVENRPKITVKMATADFRFNEVKIIDPQIKILILIF
jgi:hypothetical protein